MAMRSKKGKQKPMALPELTDHLIKDPQVASKLRLADSYMLQVERMGRQFRVPEEHSDLTPIIERYSRNFSRFVSYVKDLRDTVPPRSESYIALHELYRMLEVRLVQQQRRERARKALAWLEKNYPKLNSEQKLRWVRKLEQQWGKRRMAAMDDVRRKTLRGRLSTTEREGVLQEFWHEIDQEVEKGDLPAP
jgi:Ca2+-binding EF-hand superfamily protein